MNAFARKSLMTLTSVNHGLCKVVMLVIIGLTSVMVASLCAQVFWRYVLNDSLVWPEEVARYAFIWVSCLGMSVGVRRRDLIAIDVLWVGRPKRVRLFVSIATGLLIVPLLVVFVWQGAVLMDVVAGQEAAATNVPVGWIYLALPLSSVLALLFVAETLIRDVCDLSLREEERR
jgi:TRAP-type C4-dicarboxylate transport system permease small subunit